MNEQQRKELLAAVVAAMDRIGIAPKSVVLVALGGADVGLFAVPGLLQGWAPMTDLLPPGAQAVMGMMGGFKR